MNLKKSLCLLSSAFLSVIALTIAFGQEARSQSAFGAWAISCVADGPRETQCALFHRQVIENSGAVLLEVQLVGLETGRIPGLLITVPLGVNIANQLAVKIDQTVDQKFGYSTCGNRGCTVRIFNSDLIDRFSEGVELRVSYQLGLEDTQDIERTVSLFGVQEGIEKIKAAEPAQ